MATLSNTANAINPKWWNDDNTSTWDRVKEALKRDWEQTKADFSSTAGKELNQDVSDTVKQAAGSEPIPGPNTPNPNTTKDTVVRDWESVEPAYRYGYGARSHYAKDSEWSDGFENKLKEEWSDLKSGRTWEEVKGNVRQGWEKAKSAVKN